MVRKKIFYLIFGTCLLMVHEVVFSKIRLFTLHCNRPDFIELQYRCLNKFLKEKDDYELIVFNDAKDEKLRKEIGDTCFRLGLVCVPFPEYLHHQGPLVEKVPKYNSMLSGESGCVRHCQIVQYALDNFGYEHDDIIGVFEADVFLIKDFSIRDALKEYDFIGGKQTDRQGMGLEYVWIGLFFLNMKKLPNKKDLSFDLTWIKVGKKNIHLDSGGSSYNYLKNNPNVKFKKYERIPVKNLPRKNSDLLKQLGYSDKEILFLSKYDFPEKHDYVTTEFHLDGNFIHQGWSRMGRGEDEKGIVFKAFIEDVLEGE